MPPLIPQNHFQAALLFCYQQYKKVQEQKQEFKHEPYKTFGYVITGTYWPLFPFRLMGVKMIAIQKVSQVFIRSNL